MSNDKLKISDYMRIKVFLSVFFCIALSAILTGCAPGRSILAVVNGENITEDDLGYSLNIAHRRETLSVTKSLSIADYVQKLIDDRLIIQEARRMDIERLAEMQGALKAYILRESVVSLHAEEVVGKVFVNDEDIRNYYKTNFERFSLNFMELPSEEEAGKVLEQLKKGEDFKALALKYSKDPSKKEIADSTVIRMSMMPQMITVVTGLNPGEFSEAVKIQDKYMILKLVNRKEAPDDEFEKNKESIIRTIRKAREKERGDRYLKVLRDQAGVKVDKDLIAAVKPDASGEEMERQTKDERPVAAVYDSILTAGDFASMLAKQKQAGAGAMVSIEKSKEQIVNGWIDYKLVDYEALRRHYENTPELKDKIDNYKDQLLKNLFMKKVIVPKIQISDKILKDYYESHKKEFLKIKKYKIQQITVKTREEADEILKNIKGGADFAWLAKRKSIDSSRESGGEVGWLTKNDLPEAVREAVDKLKAGEVSPALELNSQHLIIRMHGRTGDEAEEFDKVKDAVARASFEMQFKEIFDKYTAELKKDAEIKINEDTIKTFEERFKN